MLFNICKQMEILCPISNYTLILQNLGRTLQEAQSEEYIYAGYRLGDPCEFPALSVLCRDPRKRQNTRLYRKDGERTSMEETEHDIAAALSIGFGTTVATAHNLGTENFCC